MAGLARPSSDRARSSIALPDRAARAGSNRSKGRRPTRPLRRTRTATHRIATAILRPMRVRAGELESVGRTAAFTSLAIVYYRRPMLSNKRMLAFLVTLVSLTGYLGADNAIENVTGTTCRTGAHKPPKGPFAVFVFCDAQRALEEKGHLQAEQSLPATAVWAPHERQCQASKAPLTTAFGVIVSSVLPAPSSMCQERSGFGRRPTPSSSRRGLFRGSPLPRFAR